MNAKKGRVLVAMSGGIDSTVAALLLHEQGYDVVGMTMKTWDYAASGGAKKETGCCSLDSINDARAAAVQNGFPHYILDIREEFGRRIIDDFVSEYMAGRTPNPCVLCNTFIKWEALLKRADALDCRYIATGHYARLQEQDGRRYISRGLDPVKDQSYVLWGLTQESLNRTLFPLADMTKQEVKALAIQKGYGDLANKSESYDICFIPDNDYRGFLKRKVNGLADQLNGGDFVNARGEVMGKHRGYPFYTIGQRKGLEVAVGEPVYVTKIIPESNTVVLGSVEDLQRNGMRVKQLTLSKYASIPQGMECLVRIRYHDPGTMASLYQEGDEMRVEFHSRVSAIAPGQSAVFYEGEDVLGGGIIHSGYDLP